MRNRTKGSPRDSLREVAPLLHGARRQWGDCTRRRNAYPSFLRISCGMDKMRGRWVAVALACVVRLSRFSGLGSKQARGVTLGHTRGKGDSKFEMRDAKGKCENANFTLCRAVGAGKFDNFAFQFRISSNFEFRISLIPSSIVWGDTSFSSRTPLMYTVGVRVTASRFASSRSR